MNIRTFAVIGFIVVVLVLAAGNYPGGMIGGHAGYDIAGNQITFVPDIYADAAVMYFYHPPGSPGERLEVRGLDSWEDYRLLENNLQLSFGQCTGTISNVRLVEAGDKHWIDAYLMYDIDPLKGQYPDTLTDPCIQAIRANVPATVTGSATFIRGTDVPSDGGGTDVPSDGGPSDGGPSDGGYTIFDVLVGWFNGIWNFIRGMFAV